MAPDPADLAAPRLSERTDCLYTVSNAVQELKDILLVMSNHIASMHPASGGSEGGGGAGGAKSNAAIPALDEDVTEIQWAGWLARFKRISDKAVENRILEAIPSQLADQICVGLVGNESKAELLVKIKDTIVKKRSVFLHRSDLHRTVQNRGETPERYAARIRQAAPPCQLMTDSGTADYAPDLMSSIFILGLSDTYTKEKLFQLQPKAGKRTVEFDELVRAAPEIAQAKGNCLEVRSSSVCGVSGVKPGGGKKRELAACHSCNTMSHSDKGCSREVREKFCKAFKAKCKNYEKTGHFTDLCFHNKGFKGGPKETKKAKVSVLTAEETAPDTAAAAVAKTPGVLTAPAATLNSVEQVQPYQFNPDRYQDYDMGSSGWWSLEAVKPIKVQRLWAAKMEATSAAPALGHFIFDNV